MSVQDTTQLEGLARRKIANARTIMLAGRKNNQVDGGLIFFATLVMRLKVQADWSVSTMATDGRHILYNPEFTCGLNDKEVVGVLIHETLHCALLHFLRVGERNHHKFNVAADAAINQLIEQSGFTLPRCRLMPGEGTLKDLPRGLSAEHYYDLLPDDLDGCEGGLIGDVLPEARDGQSDSGEMATLEATWRVAINAAAEMAKSRGSLPAALDRCLGETLDPPLPWRHVLREFVSRQARNEFTWRRPNRRLIAGGHYLPGLFSEELGELVVAVDTSGSIDGDLLAAFENELNGILDAYPCTTHIIYCDARVQAVDTFTSQDYPVKLTPRGGGGTHHDPVIDYIQEQGWDLACAIFLTDGYTLVTRPQPDFPCLWCLCGGGSDNALPWGQIVRMGA